MKELVLIRHGQSIWNLENRFTGWVDVDLSDRGLREARDAGKTMLSKGYRFDVAMTSLLKRSIRTLWLILDEMDQMHLPVKTDWRLNERHYGALQGLDKKETTLRHGNDQVLKWRRGYAIRPPALEADDPQHPSKDPKYSGIARLPDTESLADTLERVTEWWEERLAPELKAGRRVLVVAHGNSLRAMVKFLQGLSEDEIMQYNIPTGIPLVFRLNDALEVVDHEYLADEAALSAAVSEVKNQASSQSER
ncbi:MAG: 2,3-diphosphoglycerate-dependent phosphoglycerate mutase [Arenicellales bacterium]|nr:2,3-diphosphoglycerate-dependent phosphoglycerate mutase [Arenicellales bacterium]